MEMLEAIKFLENNAPDPTSGLPEELFLFASRITPMVNVDLLIRDDTGRTLLSWRDDDFFEPGWHIPGGIVRYKEKFETRIKKVAEIEIGTEIDFDPAPLAINQVFQNKKKNRGHFISILYRCYLSSTYNLEIKNQDLSPTDSGYLKWHSICPPNLIETQEMYRSYLNDHI
ncbi:MAG: NUDIX domain-containing protein [Oligoflexia bacterium]|nr:NUDIX domain-containing protein [Oligoflexia bacterium]